MVRKTNKSQRNDRSEITDRTSEASEVSDQEEGEAMIEPIDKFRVLSGYEEDSEIIFIVMDRVEQLIEAVNKLIDLENKREKEIES